MGYVLPLQRSLYLLAYPEQKYAALEGPYQEQAKKIYTELRTNIIDNVFKEYERTGYVWEQYNALTGEGRRSHPFTGWTSLVSLSKHKPTLTIRYSAQLLFSRFRKVLIRISTPMTIICKSMPIPQLRSSEGQ
jgi:hypothetical protein